MKRVLMMALVAAGICGFLAIAADEVTSVNAVGYIKVEMGEGFTMVRNDFVGLSTDLTPAEVFGEQLPIGSKIWMFDPVQGYSNSEFKEEVGPPPGFVTTTNWTDGGTMMLDVGKGMWVDIPQGSLNGGTTTIVFMGEVPDDDVAATNVIVAGFNMVGYSFPVDTIWTNTTLAAQAQVGDKVWIYTPGQGYSNNELKEDVGPPPGFITTTNWTDPSQVIEVGQAFWYEKTGGSPIDWVENAPYDLDN